MRGFHARRGLIGPAFLLSLALNHDLYLPSGPAPVPLAVPRDMPLPPVAPVTFSGGWAGAPVPPAMAPKAKLRALPLVPDPDVKARREAIEKRLRAGGAATPAFVSLRALAELAAPLARISRALELARRKDDVAEQRKLLEAALATADEDDLVTREKLLRLLAAALAHGGQLPAAQARAKEADDLLRKIAQIELAELAQHPNARELHKSLGQDPVARREELIAKLGTTPPVIPGLTREDDAKKMGELWAKVREGAKK